MHWRWDQGRLEYFQYDEIKKIAQALVAFDGGTLPRGSDSDTLRTILEHYSDQPFAPDHYKVWRNYGRVFGCQLLATKVDGLMVCTDLCRQVASNNIDVDDYFLHFATRFYYPSPVFEGYKTTGAQTFPVCAIIKLLLARYASRQARFDLPYPFNFPGCLYMFLAQNRWTVELKKVDPLFKMLTGKLHFKMVNLLTRLRNLFFPA